MRFESLTLECWGPFPGPVAIPLDRQRPRLHVLYGPNEAGKSSALRAIDGLLFGIPERTRDAHRHEMRRLRLGAVLRNEGGERFAIQRRKGRKGTLLDPETEQPLSPERWHRWLAGVDRSLFESLYGLNHERMREGAQDLLKLEGAAAGVFAASSMHALRDRQRELAARARELHAPRARKTALNEARARIRDLEAKLRDTTRRDEAQFKELTRERAGVESRLAEIDRELPGLERDRQERNRLHTLGPQLRRWEALQARLESLGDRPAFPAEADSHLRDARTILIGISERRRFLEARRAELSEQLEALANASDDELLRLEPELAELTERADRARGSMGALPDRARDRERVEEELSRLENVSHAAIELDSQAFEDLRKRAAALIDQDRKLRAQREEVSDQLRKLRARLADEDAGEPQVELAGDHGDHVARLEGELQDADRHLGNATGRRERAARRRECEQDVAATLEDVRELWSGSAAELLAASWPTEDALEAAESRQRESAEKRRDLAKRICDLEDQVREASDRAALAIDLPREDALTEHRASRDAHWRRLRRKLLHPTELEPASDDEIGAFEGALGDTDSVADRLIAAASQLETRRAAERDIEQLTERIAALQAEQSEAENREAERQEDLAALVPALSTPPEDARRLRPLLRAVERIRDTAREMERIEGEEREDQRIGEDIAARLAASIQALGGAVEPELGLAALESIGKRRLESHRKAASERELRDHKREALERDVRDQAAKLGDLERKLQRQREELARIADRIDGERPERPESLAASLDAAARARELETERRELVEREAEAKRAIESFRAALRNAQNRVGEGADAGESAADPHTSFEQLRKRVDEARTRRDRRKALEGELERCKSEIEAAREEAAKANAVVEQLHRQAGSSTDEELDRAIERWTKGREFAADLREREDALSEADPHSSPGELLARLKAREADLEEGALKELQARVDSLGQERDELRSRRDQIERDLELLAEVDVPELRQQLAVERAHAERLVEEYLELDLAQRMAARVIEHRTREDEGPVLSIARELFPRLTHGRYESLELEWSDSAEGQHELFAHAAADHPLGPARRRVASLSDGTRDQLYLALRLGHILHRAERGQVFPVVLDDVLVHSDESRAGGVLDVLGEVGRRTQVLLFTHQRRVLELAGETVPTSDLELHDLEAWTQLETSSEEAVG